MGDKSDHLQPDFKPSAPPVQYNNLDMKGVEDVRGDTRQRDDGERYQ
jgi:hypothetical protein